MLIQTAGRSFLILKWHSMQDHASQIWLRFTGEAVHHRICNWFLVGGFEVVLLPQQIGWASYRAWGPVGRSARAQLLLVFGPILCFAFLPLFVLVSYLTHVRTACNKLIARIIWFDSFRAIIMYNGHHKAGSFALALWEDQFSLPSIALSHTPLAESRNLPLTSICICLTSVCVELIVWSNAQSLGASPQCGEEREAVSAP